MRKNDKAIFKDKDKLTIMLNLRLNGYTVDSLALLYKCDKKAIKYQCRKYDIAPVGQVCGIEKLIHLILPKVVEPIFRPPSHWMVIDGERINMGRPYKEYFLFPYKK